LVFYIALFICVVPCREVDAASTLILHDLLVGTPGDIKVSRGLRLWLVQVISFITLLQFRRGIVVAGVDNLHRGLLRASLRQRWLGLIGCISFLMLLLLLSGRVLLLLLLLLIRVLLWW
jgi:hypothetical protein